MKILLIILYTRTFFDSSSFSAMAKKNFAVTSLIEHEQYYINMKKSRLPFKTFEYETYEMKNDICAAIIQSPLFHIYLHLDPVYLHDKYVIHELKRLPEIYNEHIRNEFSNVSSTEFLIPYKMREMTVKKITYSEFAFSCVARVHGSGFFRQYFITPEYDVNESPKEDREKVMGRFVFENKFYEGIVLVALAEEPAHKLEHGPDSVEHIFLDDLDEERERNDTEVVLNRTICDLTTFQKIRLCSSILSADDSVQIVLEKSGDEPKCVLKEIHFEHFLELHYNDDYDQWWEPGVPIDDWMLECKAVQTKNNKPTMYYISRGFSANRFFVSRESKENTTLLESIRCNCSVVPAVYS